MPGTPTSVTSCGERSSRTRAERRDEQLELAAAADERRDRPLRDVDAEARARLQRLPGADRLALPLADDRLGVAVVDRVRGRPVGLLADEDAVQRRSRLQARGRVDDVAGRHRLALARPRAERDQRLARVHRDPHLQLLALLARPVADRERRPHRALRVVLVRDRRAEERHHRVADELLDRAAEALELRTKMGVVRREQRAHVLGVEPLRPRREPDEVARTAP